MQNYTGLMIYFALATYWSLMGLLPRCQSRRRQALFSARLEEVCLARRLGSLGCGAQLLHSWDPGFGQGGPLTMRATSHCSSSSAVG